MKFKINTGEFKHPIELGKNITGKTDDDGIPIKSWQKILKAKAKITNIKLDEISIAEGDGDIESKNFYIRFNKKLYVDWNSSNLLNKPDFLKFQDKLYSIKSIDDIDNAGMILQLKGEFKS